ncbi:SDR family NAD(P)-dependent oxidoreductase [Aspergillus stella-maris]|uniref:SDR family NAD(P)-dependent oxidoreductase n=1 Tax=Aspergillus stella-maris TaxID=1810926 RepID=UPI003CCE00AD
MITLHGIALITGAGSGIGQECALAFAAHGALGVILADLDLAKVQVTAEESKKAATNPAYRAIAIAVDVGDAGQVQGMVSWATEIFGRIDYNVNCAGVSMSSAISMEDITPEEWERVNRVNVLGILHSIQAVAKIMKNQDRKDVLIRGRVRDAGRGSIVNIGSIHSFLTAPGTAQYTASKHAMLGLTKSAAIDCAAEGIRVNAVCPSYVSTPMINGNPELAQIHDVIPRIIPLGRIAEPCEVADVAILLSSSMTSYVTGAAWMVDGGFTSCTSI